MNDNTLRQAMRIRLVMGKLIDEKMMICENQKITIHPVLLSLIGSFGDFLDHIIIEETDTRSKQQIGEMLQEILTELRALGQQIEREENQKATGEMKH